MPRVLVYAGIDEAGYGPLLGPLCVACTVFSVADHARPANSCEQFDPACDLWKRLNRGVCRKRTDKRRRIAVEDSKTLKCPNDGPHHPLKFLERAVLSFLGPSSVSCCSDLFALLGVQCRPHAWYGGGAMQLPVGQTLDELRIAASRLRKTLDDQRVSCERIRCDAIDPLDFNDQVERMGNKANVNLCAAMRLIDEVWTRWAAHDPFIAIDHLGGRTRYLQTLMQAYPDAHAQVIEEQEHVSSYRLTRRLAGLDSTLELTFRVEAESRHLPVALASMTAKYVRELFMQRLNRHFTALMPELKPTAGYNEDGRRYLQEIEPLIAKGGVDRRALVRSV